MSKINIDDYVEEVEIIQEGWRYEIYIFQSDKDYKKHEKIKTRKHTFGEDRNFNRKRDKQKSHRTIRTDKII